MAVSALENLFVGNKAGLLPLKICHRLVIGLSIVLISRQRPSCLPSRSEQCVGHRRISSMDAAHCQWRTTTDIPLITPLEGRLRDVSYDNIITSWPCCDVVGATDHRPIRCLCLPKGILDLLNLCGMLADSIFLRHDRTFGIDDPPPSCMPVVQVHNTNFTPPSACPSSIKN